MKIIEKNNPPEDVKGTEAAEAKGTSSEEPKPEIEDEKGPRSSKKKAGGKKKVVKNATPEDGINIDTEEKQ